MRNWPAKRYNSGSLILTMENAGQFIEDEALREQIKGAGIGTSATRDGIITKLEKNKYISLNKKTQIVTPTFLGEIIYDIVYYSIRIVRTNKFLTNLSNMTIIIIFRHTTNTTINSKSIIMIIATSKLC